MEHSLNDENIKKDMPPDPAQPAPQPAYKGLRQQLITAIADLDEDKSLEISANFLSQNSDKKILEAALEGLKIVGQRYEAGEYFIAGLVMAGEIMRQILAMVSAKYSITKSNHAPSGVIVIGTIEGDIHDLGKDLAKEVLLANGFIVHDIGVDVAPEIFLAEAIRHQPDLVGISILISSSYPALTRAVTQLRTLIPAGFKRPGVVIGGGAVNQLVFEHIKADLWGRDLTLLGELCLNWISTQNKFKNK